MKARLGLLVVAFVALLPFVRGIGSGQTFYFRDLSRFFFPMRRFVVEGLREGQIRYWNPYIHEGAPLTLPPVSYPLDLLQVLLPNEAGFSLLLALHVPLCALTFMVLSRGLGAGALASGAAGLVYALGGFCLSVLNLYVYLQTMAWVPLMVLFFFRAARGEPRSLTPATLALAMTLSTTGIEIVLQGLAIALVLAVSRASFAGWRRAGASLLLGVGIAAPTILVMTNLAAESTRGQGMPTYAVLSQSIHPVTYLQVVVANLRGDLANLADRWWGSRFGEFPYIASLYLGLPVVSLAAIGARHGTLRRRLIALLLVGAAVGMGSWAGLTPLIDALPELRTFRYPVKVFFTVHVAMALLAASGFHALVSEGRSAWRLMAKLALALGGVAAAVPVMIPRLFPSIDQWFLDGFFPQSYSWPGRIERAQFIANDSVKGGLAALAVGGVALLHLRGLLGARVAALAVAGIIASDLLRAGAGINPTAAVAFLRPSEEVLREVSDLPDHGRLTTCSSERGSPAYWEARRTMPRHETWTFATLVETLTPNYNMTWGIPTAYSLDATSLVPTAVPSPNAPCTTFSRIAERLRVGAVVRVFSFDPIEDPSLRPRTVISPARIAPLSIHVYDLLDPLPRAFVATTVRPATGPHEALALSEEPGFQRLGGVAVEGMGSVSEARGRVAILAEAPGYLEIEAEADRHTALVIRDTHSRGWSAWVNGAEAPVYRANGRHRAVPVGPGRCRVVLRYSPPGLKLGIALSALSGAVLLGVWLKERRTTQRAGGEPSF